MTRKYRGTTLLVAALTAAALSMSGCGTKTDYSAGGEPAAPNAKPPTAAATPASHLPPSGASSGKATPILNQ